MLNAYDGRPPIASIQQLDVLRSARIARNATTRSIGMLTFVSIDQLFFWMRFRERWRDRWCSDERRCVTRRYVNANSRLSAAQRGVGHILDARKIRAARTGINELCADCVPARSVGVFCRVCGRFDRVIGKRPGRRRLRMIRPGATRRECVAPLRWGAFQAAVRVATEFSSGRPTIRHHRKRWAPAPVSPKANAARPGKWLGARDTSATTRAAHASDALFNGQPIWFCGVNLALSSSFQRGTPLPFGSR